MTEDLEEKLREELEKLKSNFELEYHCTSGYYVAALQYGEEEKYWQYMKLLSAKKEDK